MFKHLGVYKRIIVTGPQRSGTRILTKMISNDLGYGYIDETVVCMLTLSQVASFLRSCERVVVQCPTLCRYIHYFSDGSTAVVMSYRKMDDIIRSQERIEWGCEQDELVKYGLSSGVISEVKYDFWEKHQKDKVHYPFDVKYEDLRNHPLWLESYQRLNFDWDQTELKSLEEIKAQEDNPYVEELKDE